MPDTEQGRVRLVKLEANQDQFRQLSPREKKRFLMLTLHLRDVGVLLKFLMSALNTEQDSDPHTSAHSSIHLCCLTLIISKLHEAWTFVNRNQLLASRDTFSDELNKKIQSCEDFFDDEKNSNLFAFIRDKFGFHYEYQNDIDAKVNAAFNSFSDIVAWLSSGDSGNEIFATSNLVALKIIVEIMRELGFEGDDGTLMGKLIDLAMDASSLLQALAGTYMVETTPVMWDQTETIELEAPYAYSVEFPSIIAKNPEP